MAIKVCDAIMGSGKSSAAIQYMNEHPEQKYIYITPYLEETERIRNACPDLHFVEPSSKLPEFDFRKFKHTVELIRAGKNISSTHNMFLRYTDDMVDMIRKQGYILIVDEAVEVLRPSKITTSDMELLERAGWVERKNGLIQLTPTFNYQGGFANEIVALSKGNRLIDMPDMRVGYRFYYWLYSSEILLAFKDVYVLTYLFSAQTMKYYLDMLHIPFKYIGIRRDESGGYHFSERLEYIPEYTRTLSQKIHVYDRDKMNDIGNSKTALSHTWYERNAGSTDEMNRLKNNVYNYFINVNRGHSASERLWAAYKNGEGFVRGKGYYYSGIAFNAKATNNFRDKRVLAYCVNIFLKPQEKSYLMKCGVDVREDEYALSVMLQWIWRSAIRDGDEIWIYIPSSRMRTLLRDWIQKTEQEYIIHNKETANT